MITEAPREDSLGVARRKGHKPNPKIQKTFFLPEDLSKLADAYERDTGINITRQVSAALIDYYFRSPGGPDPRLIRWVVQVEQGRISPLEIPRARLREQLAHAEEALERAKALRPGRARDDLVPDWSTARRRLRAQLSVFEEILESEGSLVEAFARHWGGRSRDPRRGLTGLVDDAISSSEGAEQGEDAKPRKGKGK